MIAAVEQFLRDTLPPAAPAEPAPDPWLRAARLEAVGLPVEFGLETMNHFIDWNRKVPFQVIRGEGECAV